MPRSWRSLDEAPGCDLDGRFTLPDGDLAADKFAEVRSFCVFENSGWLLTSVLWRRQLLPGVLEGTPCDTGFSTWNYDEGFVVPLGHEEPVLDVCQGRKVEAKPVSVVF